MSLQAPLRTSRRIFAVFALASTAFVMGAMTAQAQMTFTTISLGESSVCGTRCPAVIQAEGRITNSSALDFVNYAKQASSNNRLMNIVLIHSPGGNVVGSMQLGSVFRALGATVVVARVNKGSTGFFGWGSETTDSRTGKVIPQGAITNASCNSACVYAVMGGRKRVIPPQSNIGIHRMQSEVNYGFDPLQGRQVSEKKTGTADQVTALKRYARAMGIDQRLITEAESIPHDQLKVLSPADVRRFKLGVAKL